jgi:threonine aldolase
MSNDYVDLRSDTVTRPTAGMREAMATAEVGDDVFDDDPSVHRLQERLAEMLGKEAALYVPSGTMSNQIAVRIHCRPGDELICERGCHIYRYEQGGFAQLSGVVAQTIDGTDGLLELDQLEGLIRQNDIHEVYTRLVTLENTHNYGGGRVLPMENVAAICQWAHDNDLRTHLDGARLFNAVVASGIAADEWSKHFDTVSICFSKGLGAPVGSALAGTKEAIREARRHRKLFGGGMRQAGVIAAAALYALDHHVERLADDHRNARRIGEAVEKIDGLTLRRQVDTNIVFFDVDPALGTANEVCDWLNHAGVWMIALAPQRIRAVTHLGVTDQDIDRAIEALENAAQVLGADA